MKIFTSQQQRSEGETTSEGEVRIRVLIRRIADETDPSKRKTLAEELDRLLKLDPKPPKTRLR